MEEESGISAIEKTATTAISNDSPAILFNDKIRFSNPEKWRSPRQISGRIRNLIEDSPKTMIRPNQVGIDILANNEKAKDLNQKHQENVQPTWDSEKTWHENNAFARENIFASIIQNDDTEFSWTSITFYTFAIVLAGSSINVPYLLFPAHDIIKFPKYWYEILYHGSVFGFLGLAYQTAINGALLNIRYTKQYKTLSIVCAIGSGALLLFDICAYYSWTLVFSFNFPIPFYAHLRYNVILVISCLSIWLMIPKEWRSQERMKKSMKYILAWILATGMMVVSYQVLIVNIGNFRGPYQPLIALAFPASRELWNWSLMKIPKHCVNGDERGAMIEMLYAFYTNHTICLSYAIGSVADNATSWTLILSDFILNIYHCITIVRLQKRNPSAITSQMDLLHDLAIAELSEFQCPLSTTIVFAIAFYSPVGSVIGNIKNSYWAFEAVEDINDALTNMAVFFSVDLVSTIATYVVLQIYCKINYFKIVTEIQKEFFGTFILYLAFLTLGVRKNMKSYKAESLL